jgi:hypothetical protein
MTIGAGGPRSRQLPESVSTRLRAAVSAAHTDAVRAVAAAEEAGISVNRDLVELIELQRRITGIAERLEQFDIDGAR